MTSNCWSNAEHKHKELPPHTHEDGYYQNQVEIPSAGESMEKAEPCALLVGNENGAAAGPNSTACLKIVKRSESRNREETFAHPWRSSIVHNSQEMEATQMFISG